MDRGYQSHQRALLLPAGGDFQWAAIEHLVPWLEQPALHAHFCNGIGSWRELERCSWPDRRSGHGRDIFVERHQLRWVGILPGASAGALIASIPARHSSLAISFPRIS